MKNTRWSVVILSFHEIFHEILLFILIFVWRNNDHPIITSIIMISKQKIQLCFIMKRCFNVSCLHFTGYLYKNRNLNWLLVYISCANFFVNNMYVKIHRDRDRLIFIYYFYNRIIWNCVKYMCVINCQI